MLAAREARDRFAMINARRVLWRPDDGSYLALQQMNPTPCTLVAVEPDPKNFEWIKRLSATMTSMQIGIGCLQMGFSDCTDPVLFSGGFAGFRFAELLLE